MSHGIFSRLRFFLHLVSRRPVQAELDDELRFHLEQSIEAHIASGMSPVEARRQALIEFGGVERTREQCYQARPAWWLGSVAQDIRYALRGFGRNPVFTITVIATLAVGIGATTSVFSVVDRILFRSLPYAQGDRLVSLGLVQSLERQEFTVGGFFFDWRDNQKPFDEIASQGTMLHACSLLEANPEQINCIHAQAGFLPLLGIAPVLGRNFTPEEDQPNGPPVALISYQIWQAHFNSDPQVLNRSIDIDGSKVRVIGVLPKGFELPTLQEPDVMLPLALNEGLERKASPGSPMRTFARLKPGVRLAEARAQMEPLFERTRDSLIPEPIRKDFHLSVRTLRDRETKDVQLTAWILLGAVLAVLSIACANVAGLLMARGVARSREQAVRAALGASTGRLISKALTEALLLAIAGAAAGMALAEGLLRIFVRLAPTGIAFLDRAQLDGRVALFTVLLALVCGCLFGIIPAIQTPRPAAMANRADRSVGRARLRRLMVVSQLAISMVLLAAAALLITSFRNLRQQSLGLQSDGVTTVRIALPGSRYNSGEKKMDFYLAAEKAVRRLPGVRAVAFSDSIPPGGWHDDERMSDLTAEGRPPTPQGSGGSVVSRGVTPEYFTALNIPIIRGRAFAERERSSVGYPTVISRLMAAKLFPEADPIGQRFQRSRDGTWFTVKGVAENVKNAGLAAQDDPEIYSLRRNLAQDWGGHAPVDEIMSGAAPIMIISSIEPEKALAPWVRAQIAQIDHTVPVTLEPLTQTVSKLADKPRFETALLGFFAVCGLLMAVIGLYGLISFVTTQRTQEIGVRMALGATRADILMLVIGESIRLIAFGVAAGLAAALGASQLIKSLLFQVTAHDPVIYAAVVIALCLVALAATLIPARAAMRVQPVEALRCE